MLSDLPYLSHLERFLMLHTSLETKTPWCSTGQCNYHFLCNHCCAFSVIFCSSLIFVFCLGPLSPLAPLSTIRAPSESSEPLFACHSVKLLMSLLVQLQGRLSHLNTHARTHAHLQIYFCPPTYTRSGPVFTGRLR